MKRRNYYIGLLALAAVSLTLLTGLTDVIRAPREKTPLFIVAIAAVEDGDFVVAEKGTRQVTRYNAAFTTVKHSWKFDQTPSGLTVAGGKMFVTTFDTSGELFVFDLAGSKQLARVKAGSGATAPCVNPSTGEIYVLNQFAGDVTAYDPTSYAATRSVKVIREPRGAVVDKTGRYLYVTNNLPRGRGDAETVAACVSLIDLTTFERVKDIPLYNGSNALRSICLSTEGRYVFVTHNLGRFQVPTNQLQQGWMNTNAMSVIDTASQTLEGTVLLDESDRGAAGIWGVASTPEAIIVTHSGTHDVSIIDYKAFVAKFEAYPNREALAYDLRFLYGIRTRTPLKGNGPRDFVVRDGVAYIPTYFSDTINVLKIADRSLTEIPLVADRQESAVQSGEKYFNDATYCFQNWQSCNGCHPGDARMDAMNWDLMNDGIGNPKNCKSLLFSYQTPPSMISGIRAMAEIATRKGFALIQFSEIPEEKAAMVDEYLKSLQPVPSPYLVNGKLSAKAERGKKVFEALRCGQCHSGEYYTDMKMHRIGKDVEFEKGWDTPTLREVWRTAPYLFDGRAAEMIDVFTTHRHGIHGDVSRDKLEDLAEYVNSL